MVCSRKASLSLSINAIVILVLAITMLGLGLAFTKGMFGKLSSKLSVPEPDIPATADDPIVLPTEELQITKNKEFIFSVNFYNDGIGDPIRGKLYCPEGTNQGAGKFAICSSSQSVPAGEDKGFKFIIPGYVATTTETRVCTIGFWKYDTATANTGCTGKASGKNEPDGLGADFTATDNAVTKQIVVTIR